MSGNNRTIGDLLSVLTEGLSLSELRAADIKSSLSFAIATHRINIGLSQKELAHRLGKTQSTVAKWENGDQNFTVETLAEIATILDMELTVKLQELPTKDNISSKKYHGKIVQLDFSRRNSSSYGGVDYYNEERKEM